MKKLAIPSSETHFVNGICLRLEDLEHILGILERDNETARITDEDFEYDSFAEMCERTGPVPTVFSLEARSSEDLYKSLSIQINKGSVVLHRWGSMDSFYEIKDFLFTNRSYLFAYLNPFIWALFLVGYIILVGRFATEREISDSSLILGWFIGACILLLILVISVLYRTLCCGVRLTRRHSAGFLRRNYDNIVLLLVGTVLGSLGSLFVQWVID